MSEILARLYRGNLVESVHRGNWVITDRTGKIVHYQGDHQQVVYWRSSAKPIQAIPLIAEGVADHFNFTPAELALCCASHSGENYHVQTISSILKKIDLQVSDLQCGVHLPGNQEATRILLAQGKQP